MRILEKTDKSVRKAAEKYIKVMKLTTFEQLLSRF